MIICFSCQELIVIEKGALDSNKLICLDGERFPVAGLFLVGDELYALAEEAAVISG